MSRLPLRYGRRRSEASPLSQLAQTFPAGDQAQMSSLFLISSRFSVPRQSAPQDCRVIDLWASEQAARKCRRSPSDVSVLLIGFKARVQALRWT